MLSCAPDAKHARVWSAAMPRRCVPAWHRTLRGPTLPHPKTALVLQARRLPTAGLPPRLRQPAFLPRVKLWSDWRTPTTSLPSSLWGETKAYYPDVDIAYAQKVLALHCNIARPYWSDLVTCPTASSRMANISGTTTPRTPSEAVRHHTEAPTQGQGSRAQEIAYQMSEELSVSTNSRHAKWRLYGKKTFMLAATNDMVTQGKWLAIL